MSECPFNSPGCGEPCSFVDCTPEKMGAPCWHDGGECDVRCVDCQLEEAKV